jgi:hypothetical protein
MVSTAEVIEAEAQLLYEATLPPPPKFFGWERLPECLKDIWRMRVALFGERADLA